MTNSQPPLSPNSAVGTPASPVPKWSEFRPIEAPASPSSSPPAYSPQPYAPPLSPVSPYSTSSSSAPWSPASASSATLSPGSQHSPSQQPNARQPRRYNEDDDGIQDLFIDRSLADHYRLQAAKHRSLTLLDSHLDSPRPHQASTSNSSTSLSANRMNLRQAKELGHEHVKGTGKDLAWNKADEPNNVNTKGFVERSVTEEMRLHGSKHRSLALLETYAESVRPKKTEGDKAYEQKLKSIPREDDIYNNQANHRRKSMHMMASSTRPKKPLTAEDVRDPETVAGMKSQLDLDRERAAEKKALLLLDIISMF